MRLVREEVLPGLQLEDSPAHAHRRETLRLLFPGMPQAVHAVLEPDCARENALAEGHVPHGAVRDGGRGGDQAAAGGRGGEQGAAADLQH